MARKTRLEADNVAVETANHLLKSLHSEIEYWKQETLHLREWKIRVGQTLKSHGIEIPE